MPSQIQHSVTFRLDADEFERCFRQAVAQGVGPARLIDIPGSSAHLAFGHLFDHAMVQHMAQACSWHRFAGLPDGHDPPPVVAYNGYRHGCYEFSLEWVQDNTPAGPTD